MKAVHRAAMPAISTRNFGLARRDSTVARAGNARVRASDDGHLAAECAEVAEDVTTPPAAADEAYDHAGTA